MNVSLYDAQVNVCHNACLTIGTIIEHAPESCNDDLQIFFNEIINHFKVTLIESHFKSKEVQENFQVYFVTIISSILVGNRFKVSYEQASDVLNNIHQTFIQRKDIYPEGLSTCSSFILGKLYIHKIFLKQCSKISSLFLINLAII